MIEKKLLVLCWLSVCCYLWILLAILPYVKSKEESARKIRFEDVAPLDYDYLTLPKTNGSPVVVVVSLHNVNIRTINENDMSFTVTLGLWQSWVDDRLTFPIWAKTEYNQLLDSEWKGKLWTPKLHFENAVDGKLQNIITPLSFFWISGDNTVDFYNRLNVNLICDMDFHKFPHDVQTCGWKISSTVFMEHELLLFWGDDGTYSNDFSSLRRYEMIGSNQGNCLEQTGPVTASCLEGQIFLKRKQGFYVINVYIPTVLIVIMSMLTFWIPPDAVPARVTLGVTSLLTIITKQYQASMPNVSYIVALNVWLSCCITFVFFSLLEFATVVAWTSKAKSSSIFASGDPNLILPLILLKPTGKWTFTKPLTQKRKKKCCIQPQSLDYYSRIIFPLLFIIFCIVYWRCYTD